MNWYARFLADVSLFSSLVNFSYVPQHKDKRQGPNEYQAHVQSIAPIINQRSTINQPRSQYDVPEPPPKS